MLISNLISSTFSREVFVVYKCDQLDYKRLYIFSINSLNFNSAKICK